MSNRSAAAKRARKQAEKQFKPMLEWYGLRYLPAVGLVIDAQDQQWPQIHRRAIQQWREVIDEVVIYRAFQPQQDLIVFLFKQEVAFEAEQLGSFIPLQWNADNGLSNFATDVRVQRQSSLSGLPALDLFWLGSRKQLSTANAKRFNKLQLWATPQVNIKQGIALPLKVDAIDSARRNERQKGFVPLVDKTQAETAFINTPGVFSQLDKTIHRANTPFSTGLWFALRRLLKAIGRGVTFLLRALFFLTVAVLVVYVFYYLSSASARDIGETIVTIGVLLFYGSIIWFMASLIGGQVISPKNETASRGQKSGSPHVPLWSRFKGWLKWNTPLGGDLRKKYAERMNEVQQLLRQGNIDAALKRAIAVAQADAKKHQRQKRNFFPTDLPPSRAKLDLNFHDSGLVSPILSENMHSDLLQNYRQLAQDLSAKGDYHRAAFVYSKLLGQHHAAIEELKKGEHYDEAARLALQTNQSAELIVELFYLAKDYDRALILAQRYDCFSLLADHAKKGNPQFYHFVLMSWAKRLVANRQWRKAFVVSDDLLKLASNDAERQKLAEQRQSWLLAAMDDEDIEDPEFLADILLFAPWQVQDKQLLQQSFLQKQIAVEDSFQQKVIQILNKLRQGNNSGEQQKLTQLVQYLNSSAKKQRIDQQAYWSHIAPCLTDHLVRHVISSCREKLTSELQKNLQRFAKQAELLVLAEDIKRLKTVNVKAGPTGPLTYEVELSNIQDPPVAFASVMSGSKILVWRRNKRLMLLDGQGAVLWSTPLSDVCAIISVQDSPYAFIVQEIDPHLSQNIKQRRLIRFEVGRQQLVDFGVMELRAWHDVTTDSQWLVQIGNKIGGLDLGRLLDRKAPEIAFSWSAQLTDNLSLLGFYIEESGDVSWITQDLSKYYYGLLEKWTFAPRSNAVNTSSYDHCDLNYIPSSWVWVSKDSVRDLHRTDTKPSGHRFWTNHGNEKRIISNLHSFNKKNGLCTLNILSADLNRYFPVIFENKNEEDQKAQQIELTQHIYSDGDRLILNRPDDAKLIQRSADKHKTILFSLKDGRLLIVNPTLREIRVLRVK